MPIEFLHHLLVVALFFVIILHLCVKIAGKKEAPKNPFKRKIEKEIEAMKKEREELIGKLKDQLKEKQ